MIDKPKIIFFAPILEYPPAGGPQLSVVNAVKVLNKVSNLYIITSVSSKQVNRVTETFFQGCSSSLVFSPSNICNSDSPYLQKLLNRCRRVFSPFLAFWDVLFIIDYAKQHRINIFWVDRVLEHAFYVFFWLRILKKNAFIVADTEAIHSLFLLRELPMIKNPMRWMFVLIRGKLAEIYQKLLIKKADVITAVSDFDADFFKSMTNQTEKIIRFSNVVDLIDYKDIPKSNHRKNIALLLGSFGNKNSPMDRAAKWLIEDIMPRVWLDVSDAELYIVGRNSDLLKTSMNDIRVKPIGRVESILPFLSIAKVTLVPLRHESGTRFKIIESGAAGVACISTTLGAEGLAVTDGKNILIADDTKTFVEAIISVFLSPTLCQDLGNELHKLISKQYSLGNQIDEAVNIMKYITSKEKRQV